MLQHSHRGFNTDNLKLNEEIIVCFYGVPSLFLLLFTLTFDISITVRRKTHSVALNTYEKDNLCRYITLTFFTQ